VNEFALARDVTISFQRYPYPAGGHIVSAPRSCGALPLFAASPSDIIVPSPHGEAFWIGLIANSDAGTPYRVHITARLRSGDLTDVTSDASGASDGLLVPPAFMVLGIPVGDGTFWALARDPAADEAPACDVVEVRIATGPSVETTRRSFRFALLDERAFVLQGGPPLPPLDPRAAYGGWRLP